MNKNNIIKKSIISSLIFILFVTVIFIYIFQKIEFKTVLEIFKNSNKLYLFLAFLCMFCFSIGEALNIKRTLKLLKNKVSFLRAYKYALGGFFVSSITPSSSGGDPMQLYLMTKDKISVSHSAIVLLTKLLVFQFVVITISLFSFLFCHSLFSNIGIVKYIIYLGLFLNTLVCIIYFLLIFYKRIIIYLVDLLCKLLNKFHYKKTEVFKEKIETQINEYQKASVILRKNPKIFILNLLTTYIQMLLYYSISYFVYLAFGLTKSSILVFVAIQSVLFISVSFLPFPGAVGASEATFMSLYKSIYGANVLGSAMIITRFINFYLFVFYSGVVLIISLLRQKTSNKNL